LISCYHESVNDIEDAMNDEQSIPVMVRLSPDQVTRLDDWRRAQSDLPGRPEAIRRILDDRLNLPKPTRVAARKSMRRTV
jgi:hypothetical protein